MARNVLRVGPVMYMEFARSPQLTVMSAVVLVQEEFAVTAFAVQWVTLVAVSIAQT